MQLTHYTLNTADSGVVNRRPIGALDRVCAHAIAEGQAEARVPGTDFEAYSIKITYDRESKGCLFDVCDPDGRIMTVNEIGITPESGRLVWAMFEPFYLGLARDAGMVGVVRAPVEPERSPWLATFVLPNMAVLSCSEWLAGFEQAVAATIVNMAANPKPKGFGRK